MMVVYDVWGGEHHLDHVARYIHDVRGLPALIENDLAAGYLINLRVEVAWGIEQEFDKRNTQ